MYLSARAFIKIGTVSCCTGSKIFLFVKIVTFITYHLDDELTSSIKINL